ncbi:Tubulin beta chain [Pestalotiopsis fici W106-1]|uniref:Tubulin beta chain n=1 Tax=Pestalotiopsis fici (strain W106-1 / CGMCC3.15140) TaxID=1229662 RepID=W3XGW6_PESFW|nr:Tubulin beta chain [Pestalotiopsis fici W106-1]ETS85224.1 Tubulin beta chain [Pestalotiopsis fici W106-1]
MREVIHLSVGGCGSRIGSAFWEMIAKEHGFVENGPSKGTEDAEHQNLEVYFHEPYHGIHTPRAIFVDLEPSMIDEVRSGGYGKSFRPDNFISGEYGGGGNWAQGHYGRGAELTENVLDAVRREAESCDCLQGFQICHSIGGGTGAGLGTLLLAKLKDEFPDRIMSTFSVLPSPKVAETLVETYSAVLSIHHLTEYSDQSFCFDNGKLHDTCTRNLNMPQPTYDAYNRLISTAMSGISASLRFPGQLNSDLCKTHMNLVSFPRMHFLTVGQAPLSEIESDVRETQSLTAERLAKEVFDSKNLMTAGDFSDGRHLACSTMFRGRLSMEDIEDQIRNMQNRNSESFKRGIPHNFQTSYCSVAQSSMELSSTLISNSTSIQSTFERLGDDFTTMFRRKAYMRSYTMGDLAIDEMDFTEAHSNILDLVSECQECHAPVEHK